MHLSIETLWEHAKAEIATVDTNVGNAIHNFVARVEGKTKVADAVTLLEQAGYTITPPPVVVAAPAPQ